MIRVILIALRRKFNFYFAVSPRLPDGRKKKLIVGILLHRNFVTPVSRNGGEYLNWEKIFEF
jgi:hypothetical protein